MAGYYDVYVLPAERTGAALERFVNRYTDRSVIEDGGTEKLMMVPLDYNGVSLSSDTTEPWDWEASIAE